MCVLPITMINLSLIMIINLILVAVPFMLDKLDPLLPNDLSFWKRLTSYQIVITLQHKPVDSRPSLSIEISTTRIIKDAVVYQGSLQK